MSHTSEIKAITIVDIQALRQTIAELNKAGVVCTLIENATPRAYYPGQEGLGHAPFVLQMGDSPYDIGFYGDAKAGYNARTDFFGGHIEKLLGAKAAAGEEPGQAKMGKLFQSYAVNAAVRQAGKQGYKVMRSTQADGSVQLTMTV